jgi:hypothetical protein
VTLDQGEQGSTYGGEGWAHRHGRRPAQRRYLGISQYETVT